eukprot:Nitzschia sp. Nitz4//scaffold604_size2488//315//1590//NITZ4_009292-RA/size2488-augustus-gene-0.4-mRNA-1//-1//CDS//3329555507//1101//frame0
MPSFDPSVRKGMPTNAVPNRRKRRSPEEVHAILKRASEISERYHEHFTLPLASSNIPQRDLSDFAFGKVLGRGAFGAVYAVNGLETATEPSSSSDNNDPANDRIEQDGLFALKFLSASAAGTDEEFMNAVLDNAKEARVLGALNHPHIIKIRAMPACGMFSDKSFLLLDRLEDTLKQRIQVWKRDLKRLSGFAGKVLGGRHATAKSITAWDERLAHMIDLAGALEYMHSLRVIHRDLKSDNVGFTRNNKIQLFDFGLARQLPEESSSENGLFKLTGHCGSPLYMSPEIAMRKPYNAKCDVYSFSILVWETLTLDSPFDNPSLGFLQKHVWQGELKRPKLGRTWNDELKKSITAAWSPNIADRPDMAQFVLQLRRQPSLQNGRATVKGK